MNPECLNGVLRTGWDVPAGHRQQGGNGILIDPDRKDGDPEDTVAQYSQQLFHDSSRRASQRSQDSGG